MTFDWEEVMKRSDAAKFAPIAAARLIAEAKAEKIEEGFRGSSEPGSSPED